MVDTAPSFTQQTLAAIDTADGVCVVTEPHVASMKTGNDCLAVLEKLSFPKERILLVVNRTTQRRAGDRRGRAGLQPAARHRRALTHLRSTMPPTRGRPIVVLHPDNAASKQLRDLAARLTVLAPAGR